MLLFFYFQEIHGKQQLGSVAAAQRRKNRIPECTIGTVKMMLNKNTFYSGLLRDAEN